MFSRTRASPAASGRKSDGDHVARLDAALDDLGVARVRRPERLHARAVHALDEEHLVGRDLERLEEFRREHVPVARDHGDQEAVRPAELLLVVEVGADVLVLQRQLLVEVGVELQARRRDPAERDGDEREEGEDGAAVPEDAGLEPGRDPRLSGLPHGGASPGSESRRTPPSPATISAPSPEGTTADSAFAVVLLRQREAAAAIAAHEDDAGHADDHDGLCVDARAAIEERSRARLDRGPVRAAVLRAPEVSTQAEREQRIAVERQHAVERSIVGRRQLTPVRPVVIGANRRPASAPMYMRPAGPWAIAFRWNSKPRSTSASMSSSEGSTFAAPGKGSGSNGTWLQTAPPSAVV
jgi:hypothetical protein